MAAFIQVVLFVSITSPSQAILPRYQDTFLPLARLLLVQTLVAAHFQVPSNHNSSTQAVISLLWSGRLFSPCPLTKKIIGTTEQRSTKWTQRKDPQSFCSSRLPSLCWQSWPDKQSCQETTGRVFSFEPESVWQLSMGPAALHGTYHGRCQWAKGCTL